MQKVDEFYFKFWEYIVNHFASLDSSANSSSSSFDSSFLPSQMNFNDIVNLVSPICVKINREVYYKAKRFIKNLFNLRFNPFFVKKLLENYDFPISDYDLKKTPDNFSVLMAYDFHIDPKGNLKLIEVNTNASMYLISSLLYHYYSQEALNFPYKKEHSINENINESIKFEKLKKSFLNEYNLFYNLSEKNNKIQNLIIIDENIENQKAYLEFLLYNNLFNFFKWNSRLVNIDEVYYDPIDDQIKINSNKLLDFAKTNISKSNESKININDKVDFIYNRYCDFYLKKEKSQELLKAFKNKSVCISPNSFEYFLLADKRRLIDYSNYSFVNSFFSDKESLKVFLDVFPQTFPVLEKSEEELWTMRKKLFFKPYNLYGSKKIYSGNKISRPKFNDIYNDNFLAQELIPAPKCSFYINNQEFLFKYDLRFYVYRDEIQLVIARLYKGNLTNFNSEYGGLSRVKFV